MVFSMKGLFVSFFLAVLIVVLTGNAFVQAQAPKSVLLSGDAQRALVNQYCAGCHNDSKKSGDFSWNSVDLAHPERSAERVEKAIRKLRAGLMPPPGNPRPDPTTTRNFAASLEFNVDKAAAAKPFVGSPALHRLNRAEYAASIRELLALNIDVSSLLP